MAIREPRVEGAQILRLDDPAFTAGNVCLVTGVATGIGRATAIAAAVNGLTVVGLDVNAAEAERTVARAAELGGTIRFVQTDLCDDAAVTAAVDAAARAGAIRYVANIAGIQHIDPVEDFPMEMYDRMQGLMLRAPFLLAQLTLPHMRRSADGVGVIGNMASIHAHICTKNKPVYNIVKFGLRGLTQSIAAEGAGKVRAFSVSVGYVKTPLALNQVPAQAAQRGITPEEVVRDVMMGKSRIKEMMAPIDVANLFLFGFSHHARHLIGGDLLFDGGCVLTY